MELLNTVELVYVFADATTRQPLPVPQALRDVLTAYEAGESVVRVESGSWNDLGRDAERLRLAVFVHEQGVPARSKSTNSTPWPAMPWSTTAWASPSPRAAWSATAPARAASAAWPWSAACAADAGAASCWTA
jgi:hypothetical protein